MNSPKLRAIPDNELHEVIWYALVDLYSLSIEFEWDSSWGIIDIPQISHLPRVKKYFSVDQTIMNLQKVFDRLEKLLKELSQYAQEIGKLNESEQEKVVAYIKKELDFIAAKTLHNFPNKFRDMLFAELGIDHIDDTGDIKAEVKFLLNKIMEK